VDFRIKNDDSRKFEKAVAKNFSITIMRLPSLGSDDLPEVKR
jgi:hypothetical protein